MMKSFIRPGAALVMGAALAGVLASLARAVALEKDLVFAEVVLPAPEGKVNHAPGVIEFPSGEILTCWYSGTTEANPDAVILCSRSADSGLTWSSPWTVVERGERATGASEPNKSVGNVSLFHDVLGRLWMIYGVIQRWDLPLFGNVCRTWLCSRVDAKVSRDDGVTWSTAVRFDDESGALPRSKPLRHPSLGDLVPLYLERDRRSYVRIIDLSRAEPGRAPPTSRASFIPTSEIIQPSLVPQPDGRVRAFLRDSSKTAVRTALLDPASAQWGKPVATNLPNPGSAVDSLLDDDGEFVLVYNPSTADRHVLRLASSRDGIHFAEGCDLVPNNQQGDVAYPYVIRSKDKTWHLAYSSHAKTRIHHIRFNATWLRQCLGR
jgi:predicted neuraminidase